MNKIGIFDAGVETPEEIIIAAGLTPYRLFGDSSIELEKSNEHIPPTHCLWTHNLLEQAINGLKEDIIGIVATHGCDRTNREFDIWLKCLDLNFMYFLNSPRKRDSLSLKFFVDDIKEFVSQLEEKLGAKVTENNLREAIRKMNQVRKLLREISEYRKEYKLKGSEFHQLVRTIQQIDKNEAVDILNSKLEQLKVTEPFEHSNFKNVLITGSDLDDTFFIEFLEELGFHIIIDDLGVGTKYFWNTVEEEGDPLVNLAKYHLTKPILSTKFPSYERFEVLKNLATEYNIDGVINIAQKFCEPVLYDHPYLNIKFKELGIPYLFVEVTYNRESYKQLSTRFSAFAEMI